MTSTSTQPAMTITQRPIFYLANTIHYYANCNECDWQGPGRSTKAAAELEASWHDCEDCAEGVALDYMYFDTK